MAVTYRIHVDATYYRTLIDRYYLQRPLLFRLPVQFGLLAIALGALFFFAIVAPVQAKLVGATVIGALLWIGGVTVTKWGIFQRFRWRSDFGSEATISMTGDGLVGSGPNVQSKWDWAAYPRAVRFADGIMLLRPGVIRWLPDAALVAGTSLEATELVRSKSALRDLA
jgi:hypothetical protein